MSQLLYCVNAFYIVNHVPIMDVLSSQSRRLETLETAINSALLCEPERGQLDSSSTSLL
jgi:hypothetical protein